MRRALVLLLAISAVTWLQFVTYPGHSYLDSESQLYVPALERLRAPAFFSRDLVATNPHLTYTIYDEATLFLTRALKIDLRSALLIQQLLFRAAGVLGIFLLARATRLSDSFSLLLAALLNFGASLTGPAIQIVSREPTPEAFASGLILLTLGLLAASMPLLAGLAGGLSLLYDPGIAAPVWFLTLLLLVCDRRVRALVRPAIPLLLVSLLLLANLAQLQPGLAESQRFWGHISAAWADLQRYRVPYTWVSQWPGKTIWNYLAIYVCGIWAITRLWDLLSRQVRWLFLYLPLLGVLSVPLSYLLVELLRWSGGVAFRPARSLFFTVVLSSLACGLAGLRSIAKKTAWEAWLWFTIVFALPFKTEFLALLDVRSGANASQLALAVTFAGLLTVTLKVICKSAWRPLALVIPVAAAMILALFNKVNPAAKSDLTDIVPIARWAHVTTWGNSMFVFPDAGHETYPGLFRAESWRPLWVDWESGEEVRYSEAAGAEWFGRWKKSMNQAFSISSLKSIIESPIDYVALKQANRLTTIKPVFENRAFVIYDAEDLRNSPGPLR